MRIAGLPEALYRARSGVPVDRRRHVRWVMSRRVAAGIDQWLGPPGDWRSWPRTGHMMFGDQVELDDAFDVPEIRYPISLSPVTPPVAPARTVISRRKRWCRLLPVLGRRP